MLAENALSHETHIKCRKTRRVGFSCRQRFQLAASSSSSQVPADTRLSGLLHQEVPMEGQGKCKDEVGDVREGEEKMGWL